MRSASVRRWGRMMSGIENLCRLSSPSGSGRARQDGSRIAKGLFSFAEPALMPTEGDNDAQSIDGCADRTGDCRCGESRGHGTRRRGLWAGLASLGVLGRRICQWLHGRYGYDAQARAVLDPAAEPSIACPVAAKATYHPWNLARVEADNLKFVSFTRIEDMRVDKAVSATLYGETDQSEVTVKFKKGDKWSYLAYLGEGAFLMSYDGVVYTADQSLSEVSTSLTPEDQRRNDEWLRIDCMNNQWGWLLMERHRRKSRADRAEYRWLWRGDRCRVTGNPADADESGASARRGADAGAGCAASRARTERCSGAGRGRRNLRFRPAHVSRRISDGAAGDAGA